jgi:membrane-bound metal-dependent hydrolase YbcI (DUF457 family)
MNKRGHVINAVLLSVGLGYVLHPSGDERTFLSIAEVGLPIVLGALVPDVDTAFGRHRKTLHNLPVLAVFVVFPLYFDNLRFVWIGVLTHYVLDVVGSRRGIALFYPVWEAEFGTPTGVTTTSEWADAVTVVITVLEVALAALVVYRAPGLSVELARSALVSS